MKVRGRRVTKKRRAPRLPNTLRADPTRTITIRRQFASDLFRRLDRLRKLVLDLILKEDAFGLKEPIRDPFNLDPTLVNSAPVLNVRWRFFTNPEKVKAFKEWLSLQTKTVILGTPEEELWKKFIEAGMLKGAKKALDDALRSELRADRKELQLELARQGGIKEQVVRQMFGRATVLERLKLMMGRVWNEVEGLTNDLQTTLARVLADGLSQNLSPATLADSLTREVGLAKERALRIANHETVRAHAEGQLDALEELGHEVVGLMAEWVTSGENVCPKCRELEGQIFKIADARGMIPLHPNCACSFIPVKKDTLGRRLKKVPAAKLAKQQALKKPPVETPKTNTTPNPPAPESVLPSSQLDPDLLTFSRLITASIRS